MNIKVLFKIENYKTYIKIPIYNYEGFHVWTLVLGDYISEYKLNSRYSNIKEISEGN